jgi:ABC-type transport system substrate-binding protein
LAPNRGARNHPLQIHSNTFPTVFFVQLNTHDPPFTSVRVRRALNYTVDRATVARMYGALANTPTCQMIPPGLPGYHRYSPLQTRPDAQRPLDRTKPAKSTRPR